MRTVHTRILFRYPHVDKFNKSKLLQAIKKVLKNYLISNWHLQIIIKINEDHGHIIGIGILGIFIIFYNLIDTCLNFFFSA